MFRAKRSLLKRKKTHARVEAELVRALHSGGQAQLWLSILLATLTWWVLDQYLTDWYGLVWLGATACIALLRLLELRLYHRHADTRGNARQWGVARAGLALLAAAAWSTIGFWLTPDWPAELILFSMAVLGGVTVVAAVSLGAWPWVAVLYAIIAVTPGTVNYLLTGPALTLQLTLLVCIFIAGMGNVAFLTGRSFRAAAQTKYTHARLVKQLRRHHLLLRDELQARYADQAVFTEGPVVAFRCDNKPGLPIQHISPNCERLALNAAQIVSEAWPLTRIIAESDMQRLLARLEPDEDGLPSPTGLDLRLVTGTGVPAWVYCYLMPMVNEALQVVSYNGYFLDIASRRRAEDALQREKERAEVTLQSIGDAVLTVNSRGEIDYMNAIAETLTGYGLGDVQDQAARRVLNLTQEDGKTPLDSVVDRCLQQADRQEISENAILHRADGQRFDVALTGTPIRLADGKLLGAVIVMHDMTELRSLSRELNYFATYDPLTNLLNRREFEARLEEVLRDTRENGGRHVLAYIDLDQFKIVNDTCGHRAGDDLLQQVAGVFRAQLRDGDMLARIGGDEFCVVLKNTGLVEAMKIARGMIDSVVEARFGWQGQMFNIGASIGLAAIDRKDQTVQDVLSGADMACYAAKAAGRNRVHIYQDHKPDVRQQRSEVQTVAGINDALRENRLLLMRQPIEDTGGNDREVGREHYELLLRMRDRDGGIIPAGSFLEAAERFNMMATIDRWVVRTAINTLEAQEAVPGVTLCAINLSGASLTDHAFSDDLHRMLSATSLNGRCLCFEITETIAISNLNAASEFMTRMRAFGCQFALDDFGSGVSSFAYLKHLPVDFLKIDGVFVKDLLTDPVDSAMVAAINEVGHTLGMKTVAEYVQSDEIRQALKPLGVDFVQGDTVGAVAPFAEIVYSSSPDMLVPAQTKLA